MAKVSDPRPQPGDIVIVRGGNAINCWREPGVYNEASRAGTVPRKSLGLVLSIQPNAWTYVLWSTPCIIGWCQDGFLRKVKC